MINRSHSDAGEDTKGSLVKSHQKPAEKWMRIIGCAEGISFLLLLFIAMPIKYLSNNPTLVHWLGPIHGGLFLLYLASSLAVARILNWRWLHLMLACIASVVPFGPFAFEAWLRRTSPRADA
jgi:integral membrane protein